MERIDYLVIWSSIAVLLTLWGYAPYIWKIWKGTLKPHYFSWLIWGLTTCIVFVAQWSENGGLGSYPTGVPGVLTLVVAIYCWQHRKSTILKPFDWFILILTLVSVPIWCLLADPLYSVILLTVMDVLGFMPSFRKASEDPYADSLSFYFLFFVRNFISILALEVKNLTTLVFPFFVGLFCLVFVFWVIYCRWKKKSK
ncbi:MAG: hypothetical protein O9301_08435 [Leptospira sp.]|nr:hypothetical protein [Leptospira sp.]